MDKRDAVLQASCPSIAVPQYSPIEMPNKCGERILVAANGVFLEVTRKWCKFVRKVGEMNTPVPYGTVHESSQLLAPRLPRNLVDDFLRLSKSSCDVEIGGAIIWNHVTNAYRLSPVETLAADNESLDYRPAKLGDGDHLIVDCHSHAHHESFFSPKDNEDDQWHVKISLVVGACNTATPTIKTRLCLKGIFENFILDLT